MCEGGGGGGESDHEGSAHGAHGDIAGEHFEEACAHGLDDFFEWDIEGADFAQDVLVDEGSVGFHDIVGEAEGVVAVVVVNAADAEES